MRKTLIMMGSGMAMLFILGFSIHKMTVQNVVYVDTKTVFNDFDYTKKLKKKYEKISLARQQVLDSLKFELEVLARKLENSRDEELIKIFEAKRNGLYYEQEKILKINQALSDKYDDQILTQLDSYLKEFGEKNNYDMILGTESMGTLIYSKEKYNVTTEATQFVNNRFNSKGNE